MADDNSENFTELSPLSATVVVSTVSEVGSSVLTNNLQQLH